MSRSIGKSLEAAYRRLRPHLLPAYRRAFSQLTARRLSQHHPSQPIVCCDFSSPAIDSVGGRYYFSLVRDLIDAGYFPVFTAHRATLSTFGTSRMKSLLLKENLGTISSLSELTEPYFLITDRAISPPPLARKVVTVSYEARLPQAENDIAFPVFVHPQLTTHTPLPFPISITQPRPARLFFGGNTEPGKYDQAVIRDRYGMLTRREMLEIANACFPANACFRPTEAATWLASPQPHPFVLCETQHCKIPQEHWLQALAKADFFLACPGVGMPLCHNLIESLAAGTIPILQYSAYLPPPLEHGLNCLTFHDAATLRTAIATAQSMSQTEIQHLRTHVHHYYLTHLAPGQFARKLFTATHSTLLLNAYRVPR